MGCRDLCLGMHDFVTLLGNSFLYQLRGMVLAWAPGYIFTVMALMPCFSINCSILKNVVCPSVAVSVNSLPSLGMDMVISKGDLY